MRHARCERLDYAKVEGGDHVTCVFRALFLGYISEAVTS
jgi:hypothetical protein